MTKRLVPLALILLSASSAYAQTEAAPTPASATEAPPAPAETPKAEPAPDATKEKVEALETKVAALEEVSESTAADVKKLKNLKISGFMQARYEWHDDAINGLNANTFKAGSVQNDFYIKRARLAVQYNGKQAEYLLSVDAGQNAFSVKDAEAAWIEPYTGLNLRISVGQFKYTFGHEIGLSDTVRELPERARMYGQLFNGDRDRGVKIQGQYDILRFGVSLINGNGSFTDPVFSYRDNNKFKDLVGRVGVDLGFLVAGLSGYFGPDSLYDPSNVYATPAQDPAKPSTIKKYQRLRGGVDVQGYVDVPSVGGLVLKGELVYSKDKNQAYNGIAADKCQDRVSLGYSLLAAQNIGDQFGLALRWDSYDPRLQGSVDGCDNAEKKVTIFTDATKDRVDTLGGALLIHLSPDLRATLAYEHPIEQTGKKVDNDLFTLQMQAKF